jgi:ribose transport system substrate-binding protein
MALFGVGGGLLAACGDATDNSGTTNGSSGGKTAQVKLAGLYRDLNEENFFRINDGVQYGAQKFANAKAQPLIYRNSSTTERTVVQGALNALSPGEKLALNAWNNTAESALTIANLVGNHGYFVTQWNKPDGQFPWTVGPQWVSHIQFDSYQAEIDLITELAKSMGGKGGFCYVQGLMTTTNAQDHWRGVQAALKKFPDIKLLDVQPGDWDRKKAFGLAQTWLGRYGNKVKAICSSNDDMSLGILQAVKAAGRAGDVGITGGDGVKDAITAVKNGDFVATAQFDSYWQGIVGTAIAYKAATGEINPNKLTKKQRAFNGPYYVVTKENADKYLKPPDPANYNLDNLWDLAQSQVTK